MHFENDIIFILNESLNIKYLFKFNIKYSTRLPLNAKYQIFV